MNIKFLKTYTIFSILLFVLLQNFVAYSKNNTDKIGREIIDITAPTAASYADANQISDARRGSSYNNDQFKDPTKNIYSSDTIGNETGLPYKEYIKKLYDEKMYEVLDKYGECTNIRYTVSITNVDENRYELIYDENFDRLRMKVIADSIGMYDAKDGYYKVNGKTYYFDQFGLMVLGPCRDERGNYYFFSYETGELIE